MSGGFCQKIFLHLLMSLCDFFCFWLHGILHLFICICWTILHSQDETYLILVFLIIFYIALASILLRVFLSVFIKEIGLLGPCLILKSVVLMAVKDSGSFLLYFFEHFEEIVSPRRHAVFNMNPSGSWLFLLGILLPHLSLSVIALFKFWSYFDCLFIIHISGCLSISSRLYNLLEYYFSN